MEPVHIENVPPPEIETSTGTGFPIKVETTPPSGSDMSPSTASLRSEGFTEAKIRACPPGPSSLSTSSEKTASSLSFIGEKDEPNLKLIAAPATFSSIDTDSKDADEIETLDNKPQGGAPGGFCFPLGASEGDFGTRKISMAPAPTSSTWILPLRADHGSHFRNASSTTSHSPFPSQTVSFSKPSRLGSKKSSPVIFTDPSPRLSTADKKSPTADLPAPVCISTNRTAQTNTPTQTEIDTPFKALLTTIFISDSKSLSKA
jgi:hypothetical protein